MTQNKKITLNNGMGGSSGFIGDSSVKIISRARKRETTEQA